MVERSELVYQAKVNLRDAIRLLIKARKKVKKLGKGFSVEKIDYITDKLEKILRSIR